MSVTKKIIARHGSSMKIKCAIFDFDGTLFDTMPIWEDLAEKYLRSIGKVPSPTVREDVKELSLYQSSSLFQKQYHISLSVEQIMDGINRIIEHFLIDEVLPKPGVIDFLEQMKQAGILMCISSAAERYQIEAALKRCKMDHYFEEIFTCSDVGHGKDEPIIFQEAMNYFNADRSNTIVFEDAIHAVRTAKKDGFIVVSVFDQSEQEQTVLQQLADAYIEDFRNTNEFWEFLNS